MRRFNGKLWALTAALLLCALALTACGGDEAPAEGDGGQEAAYVVLEDALEEEEYGISWRNEDIALGLKVQEILDEMIADGTAAEISNKWFGADILIKDADYYEESEAPEGDTSLDDLLSRGKLVVGLDDSFPPMGFRDENGDIVGFDIDLAAEVCQRLGVELELQPIDWDAKELELSSGKVDCLWNGLTVTDERLGAMYFTKPYIANRQVIIVPSGSDIQDRTGLAGKIVGLQKGSSALDALMKDPVYNEVKEINEYADNVTAFLDLKAGRLEAFVVDEVAGRYIIENN